MCNSALLAALLLLATSGCNDSDSDSNDVPDSGGFESPPAGDSGPTQVPPSSFAACSFSMACTAARELCYVSQECPPGIPPGEDAGTCGPETGDRLCHRRCGIELPCGAGERCEQVGIAVRSDHTEQIALCFN